MSITEVGVNKASGTLAERFSAYVETVTTPSDIALLVRSFELSLRATNKSPKLHGHGARVRDCCTIRSQLTCGAERHRLEGCRNAQVLSKRSSATTS